MGLVTLMTICQRDAVAFRCRRWGRIINMASVFGDFATAERVDYITTKTALIGLTRAVALEVARTAITCNAICPGTVLTPAIERRLQNEMQRDGVTREVAEESFLATRQPSRRFVPDANVADRLPVQPACSRHQRRGPADRRSGAPAAEAIFPSLCGRGWGEGVHPASSLTPYSPPIV